MDITKSEAPFYAHIKTELTFDMFTFESGSMKVKLTELNVVSTFSSYKTSLKLTKNMFCNHIITNTPQ